MTKLFKDITHGVNRHAHFRAYLGEQRTDIGAEGVGDQLVGEQHFAGGLGVGTGSRPVALMRYERP